MDIVPRDIEHYAEAHTSPPPEYLVALAVETELALDFPQMMVGALEGRFLEMLVYSLAPQRVLEIGTFSGYSALSMAAGLPPGGYIVTCDISEKHLAVARRFIEKSPYANAIEIREGPALDTIASLDGPFDFVFIDADKDNYINYYEAVLPKLSPRGLIAADNTLWSGQVLDSSDTSEGTVAIRAFNDHVRDDPRTEQVQLTVRDGVTLIRKV
ncbi:MAG TPA: class I SAM-dependent methyltransferase [Acidimicrobiales bacterium]|nr:class I SAM-dependent methyltransferase [Acidimicrobiales bacterium]